MITTKDKLLALTMAYEIVTDRRNENRYGFTAITNKQTMERFTYADMIHVLDELYGELKAQNVPLDWKGLPMHRLVWLEVRHLDKPIPAIFRQTMDDQAFYTTESGYVFTFAWDEMGKRWRAWEKEPTDEERSASEWM